MNTIAKSNKPKTLTKKNYLSFVGKLTSKVIPKVTSTYAKFNKLPLGELHKSSDKTVQATDGRQAIVISGIYREDLADEIVNVKTKYPIITDLKFPNVEAVIPDVENYNKVTITFPKLKSTGSWRTYFFINKETGTYYTVESPKENEDISNDYSFIITSKFLSVFAGYTLDLYFSNNRRSPIVVKSPK